MSTTKDVQLTIRQREAIKRTRVEDRVRSENAMVTKEAVDAIKCGTCARERDEGMTGT